MTPERWRQIEAVCQNALQREGEDRTRFLAQACAGDEELRREVESLLAEGHGADSLLATPVWEAAAHEFAAGDADASALGPGSQLGPFYIEALIGSGGMGEVYRARDTRLGRTVALKVLLPEPGGDPEGLLRLNQEARAASALTHPHICTLLDIRSDSGIDYLVMEHLVGQTLADRLDHDAQAAGRAQALPLDVALELGAQIADALAAAHQHGILHRDLKPGNVMLTKEGVKLLDFGLAKFKPLFAGMAVTNAGDGGPRTTPGAVLGTVNYMAPEQLNGVEPDARSELFAFGAVLYEMVTGRRAFDGGSAASVIASILDHEPPPPSECQPFAPPALDRLVHECLAKDPDKRWDSARLAAAELRRIAASLGEPGDIRQATRIERHLARSGARWRRWSFAGVATLAMLAVGAAGWRLLAPRPSPAPLQRLFLDLGVAFDVEPRLNGVALSQDGLRLAFHGTDAAGRFGLFTRRIDQSVPVRLRSGPVDYPVFSPDGQWIAGFSDGKLVKVRVTDGTVIEVCTSFAARGVTWLDDQTLVASLGPSDGLVTLPAERGAPVPLTRLDRAKGESTHRWPQAAPGGEAVIYTASDVNGGYEDARIEAVSVKTGRRAVLHRGGYGGRYLASGHVVFVRHETLFALPVDLGRLAATGPAVPVVDGVLGDPIMGRFEFSVSRNGTALTLTGYRPAPRDQLAWVTSSGRHQPLPLAPDDYVDPRVSPDGRHVVVGVRQGPGPQLLIYERGSDTPHRLVSTTWDLTPIWAPDGKHIVFGAEGEGGIHNIYWRRADGTGAVRQLTNSRNVQYASSFSPDGSRLAFGEISPETGGDVWILPLDLRNPDDPAPGSPVPFLATAASEETPAFSPDGKWLAYQHSAAGRDPYEIYIARSTNPGERWQAASRGRNPVWSRDGRQLLFQQDRQVMVVDVPIRGGAPEPGNPRPWSSDAPVRQKSDAIRNWDVADDPSRVLVLLPVPPQPSDRPRPAVTLLVNLFDELLRKAPAAR